MIRVNVLDEPFQTAYWNAKRALPVETLESPRQYGQRWREAYKCRIDVASSLASSGTWYIFDNDEDYTWFMLKWG